MFVVKKAGGITRKKRSSSHQKKIKRPSQLKVSLLLYAKQVFSLPIRIFEESKAIIAINV